MTGQDTSLQRLVRLLRGQQRNEGLTIEDMARRLGVSGAMLGMVYLGRRNPGRKFLRGVLKSYPAMAEEVHHFILRGGR